MKMSVNFLAILGSTKQNCVYFLHRSIPWLCPLLSLFVEWLFMRLRRGKFQGFSPFWTQIVALSLTRLPPFLDWYLLLLSKLRLTGTIVMPYIEDPEYIFHRNSNIGLDPDVLSILPETFSLGAGKLFRWWLAFAGTAVRVFSTR